MAKQCYLGVLIVYCFVMVFSSTSLANQAKEIRITVDDDYPPYSYMQNNELRGIYIDFVKRVAKQLTPEYEITFLPVPWKRALKLIEQGSEMAVLPPYKHIETRPYISHYSEQIGLEEVVVICHKSINLATAFKGEAGSKDTLRLGINSGYLLLNEKYKQAVANGTISIENNKSTMHNVEKLIKRRIDCYINDKTSILLSLENKINQNEAGKQSDFKVMDVISSQTAHIGFSRSYVEKEPHFDVFLSRLNTAIKLVSSEGNTLEN